MIKKAYLEQSSLCWTVVFRGFFSQSWHLAQEEQFRFYLGSDPQDTGEQWAAQAQLWFYDLFEHLWGLQNGIEHGVDFESQWLIRLTACEQSIRRLYLRGAGLSHAERHPFRATLDNLLRKTVTEQES